LVQPSFGTATLAVGLILDLIERKRIRPTGVSFAHQLVFDAISLALGFKFSLELSVRQGNETLVLRSTVIDALLDTLEFPDQDIPDLICYAVFYYVIDCPVHELV
jgi:hypothetical protein